MRDRVALVLTSHALMLATPRTRARVQVALLRAQGCEPPEWLVQRARLARGPGE